MNDKTNDSVIDGILKAITKMEVNSTLFETSVDDMNFISDNIDILSNDVTALFRGEIGVYLMICFLLIALESYKRWMQHT